MGNDEKIFRDHDAPSKNIEKIFIDRKDDKTSLIKEDALNEQSEDDQDGGVLPEILEGAIELIVDIVIDLFD